MQEKHPAWALGWETQRSCLSNSCYWLYCIKIELFLIVIRCAQTFFVLDRSRLFLFTCKFINVFGGQMKTKKITAACLFAIWLSFSISALAGGDGRVDYDLGVFALDENNFVAAEKHLMAAIQKEPANPYYYHQLGKTYLNSQRPEDAVQPLETAWKLNPPVTASILMTSPAK